MSTEIRTNDTITVTEPNGDLEIQYADNGDFQIQIEAVGINDAASAAASAAAAAAAQASLEATLTLARFSAFVAGAPLDGEEAFRFVVVDAMTFDTDLAGSWAVSTVAAAASAEFSVQKNDVEFATFTYALGTTQATFSGTLTTFAPGDVLSVTAPSPVDASLSDVSVTIAGVRNV